jgi:hypothetical protein
MVASYFFANVSRTGGREDTAVKMKVFQCSMGPELRERLRVAAEKTGESEASVTRVALLKYLARIEKKPQPETANSRR